MKILLVHNAYQQAGGEDVVFQNETDLLRAHGHTVFPYQVSNQQINQMPAVEAGLRTLWNPRSYQEIRALIRAQRPDIAHFHNTFPLISPSAYAACRAEQVPVVQTVHNYRLFCLNALFFRDHQVCEDCVQKAIPWPGVLHRCYRGSLPASLTVAAMLTLHRWLRTWKENVNTWITLTDFTREKLVQAGFAANKVVVKPNFIARDPGPGAGNGGYALFVGRLSEEKGIAPLLSAWEALEDPIPLKMIGDGPLRAAVQQAAMNHKGIEWLGPQDHSQVLEWMGNARFLIFPSICYEGMPGVILEAFARGTPVLASSIGAIPDMLASETGLLFHPGEPTDLIHAVHHLINTPGLEVSFRKGSRSAYESRYTADQNAQQLMEIYQQTLLRYQANE
jgi:glycosyltransferase involved in cell wall biosynthesis